MREKLESLPVNELREIAKEKGIKNLKKLNNCDAHSTYIVDKIDQDIFRKLHINLTCEPVFDNE